MVGRNVLKDEGLWTLGLEETVRLYTDPWLAQKPGHRVDTEPHTEQRCDARVSELIDNNGNWIEHRVREMVSSRDAELILNTMLPHDRRTIN